MASNFALYKYESDDGPIFRLRADASYGELIGEQPTDAPTSPALVKLSKTNREFGLRPRYLGLSRTATSGTVSRTYNKRLPILTLAEWTNAGNALGDVISIDGVDWTVTSRVNEDY